jgi:tetratricopeptide (TPR) repeat protein
VPTELPDDVYDELTALCKRGDEHARNGELDEAYECYTAAWDLIPEPKGDWEASTWVLSAGGDIHFARANFEKALNQFLRAMQCPGGLGNPYIHLRIGQCQFEKGNIAGASENITRAYMGGGPELFEQEHPKYLAHLRTILEGIE